MSLEEVRRRLFQGEFDRRVVAIARQILESDYKLEPTAIRQLVLMAEVRANGFADGYIQGGQGGMAYARKHPLALDQPQSPEGVKA